MARNNYRNNSYTYKKIIPLNSKKNFFVMSNFFNKHHPQISAVLEMQKKFISASAALIHNSYLHNGFTTKFHWCMTAESKLSQEVGVSLPSIKI